jgi:hypothetical protein
LGKEAKGEVVMAEEEEEEEEGERGAFTSQ